MDPSLIGPLIILAAVLIGVGAAAYGVMRVRAKARQISQMAFGTDDLIEGFRKQEQEFRSTPKSVSGATSLYLPQIKEDFPEFNYDDMRVRAENVLTSYLHCIDQRTPTLLSEGSDELKEQLRLRINMLEDAQEREQFDRVHVHQTVISRYRKEKGRCSVVFQTSFQSVHSLKDANTGKIIKGSKTAVEQGRAEVVLVYVQDISKIEDTRDYALGLNCPNCGAPVKSLGQKVCEYCGTGLIEKNIHVWTFHEVRLV